MSESRRATTRDLVGRRIVSVEFNATAPDKGREYMGDITDPVLRLDNGRNIWFTVQECEGSYGIAMHTGPIPKQAKP